MATAPRSLTKDNSLSKSRAPRRRLRDTAYERLRDAIRHQEFQPGQALSETYLSGVLGISRTPVREALQQLAQEGLVQVIPGQAVTVAAPSVQGILNLIHIRSLLEPEVARLVAESPTPQVVATLREALMKMQVAAEKNDKGSWSRADAIWHETLAHACPNSLLAELTLQMRNRTHGLSVDSQTNSTRLIDCTEEHRQVVDAIEAQQSQVAEQTMRQHIHELRESMFRRLSRI